jgi:hypothetical protein
MTADMAAPLSPEEIERLAHRRAARKMGWYFHACVYVVVNAYLYFSSQYGLRARPFNVEPALGWGLGLALHFVSVFVLGKGSGVREGMVQRERERIQREQNRL